MSRPHVRSERQVAGTPVWRVASISEPSLHCVCVRVVSLCFLVCRVCVVLRCVVCAPCIRVYDACAMRVRCVCATCVLRARVLLVCCVRVCYVYAAY